jgi:two-component system phosphate regulon sensor histidine kinase PhoR
MEVFGVKEEPTVLVVDDERVMREGCTRICQQMGCSVLGAQDGEEGLRLLGENRVDVLLLDLMMPGVSGMEVLERLVGLESAPVVIVITGYATVELAVQAMKRGAYDFIAKPFTPDQLRLVVSRALERKALQREAQRLRQERARSLRDVAEEQSRLRTIIHAMADGVLVADTGGTIVLHNPCAARLLGLGGEELLHRPIQEVASPELSAMVLELARAAPFTARAVELRMDRVGDIRAHGSPVHLPEGEPLGVVVLIQDITPLKDLDRMKSEFVAMVSHELRSPLAVIQQQIDVLVAGMAGELNQRQQELLGRAGRRVQGLLELINDLLDLARIEAGRMVDRREALELASLVEAAVAGYREMAAGKGQSLVCEPPGEPLWVVGDASALEEVFCNLLSNAVSYTPEGGNIRVCMAKRGGYVCVEVADTGVGIPPECIPRIFDKFYRVRDERTRNVVGTGLGLPIVKGIVEAHLGAVEVESKPGEGSKFRVLIPEASCPVLRSSREPLPAIIAS